MKGKKKGEMKVIDVFLFLLWTFFAVSASATLRKRLDMWRKKEENKSNGWKIKNKEVKVKDTYVILLFLITFPHPSLCLNLQDGGWMGDEEIEEKGIHFRKNEKGGNELYKCFPVYSYGVTRSSLFYWGNAWICEGDVKEREVKAKNNGKWT